MPNTRIAGRLCALTATLAALSSCALAQEIVPGRLLIKFRDNIGDSRKAEVLGSLTHAEVKRIDDLHVSVLQLPDQASTNAAVARFRQSSDVVYVEPDRHARFAQSAVAPNDPYYAHTQPQLRQINCPGAWAYTSGNPNVIIAVLDTGVNGAISDLSGKLVPGWNVVNNNSDTSDVYGHGTKVASVAAASTNNGVGVASVAWNCKVMPVRVGDASGAYYSDLASGVVWATAHGARVINMSVDVTRNSTLESALDAFRAKGGVAFCSAGNDGMNTGEGENPYIVTVGGTLDTGQWSSYSSYGNNIDIAAPYTDYTADMSGGYTAVGGTSFSAPMVAGAAALLISVNPALSSSQIEQILMQSATDEGAPGWDPYTGWGQVNVGNAVGQALGTTPVDSISPAVSIIAPSASSTVKGIVTISVNATDNNTVDSVSVYIDGNLISTSFTGPYSTVWDSTSAAEGAHTLAVVARDAAGNAAQVSESVLVSNFVDGTAPTISIVSPSAGAKIGRTVKVSVSASDNLGVSRVECYVDGRLVATSTATPFSMQWNSKSLSPGLHSLECRAYDSAGNCGRSPTISIRK